MPVHVRPFRDEDYPRYVEIANAATPEFLQTEEEARLRDAAWNHERFHRRRLVAAGDDGRLVGWGEVGHMPHQFAPDRYYLDVQVDPPERRRGVGAALYDALYDALRERGARVLRAEAKESSPDGLAFLRRRGFGEVERAWESVLNVAAFDPAPFAGAEARAAAAGVAFTTLGAERARDPDALANAYDLHLACERDVPEAEAVTDVPYDHFLAHEVEGPGALPDGYLLATEGGRYVGQSSLFATDQDPGVLYQGLTGVRREFRGKGIAMALKLRTVAYARARGKREIRTWNNTRNQPMLRINEAMGFRKEPVWFEFQKNLDVEDAAAASTASGDTGSS